MISILIRGFYPEPNPDNSLQYKKFVPQDLEVTVLTEMGWSSIEDIPMGENDLTPDQATTVMAILGDPIRGDLFYCLGLCDV